ncbi:phospholipase C/P1 nuclease [Exidia glandulosa HHB12029]|uniref:Phospholipase C/P1 nuclease n=1 Tax=Exidia glandulosa HHB12029 TaxID=1314781 RepID=A0A165ZR67_EXIGL|nr:phospholipase C/P1 nuclease [Exidia glandulosa HHB12029]
MAPLLTFCVAAAGLLGRAIAWGPKGLYLKHEIRPYDGWFLSSNTIDAVRTLLGKEYNESLGNAATASLCMPGYSQHNLMGRSGLMTFAMTPSGPDEPMNGACSVDELRDCANEACILVAISNYTIQVADETLSSESRQVALKFLTHFFGDLAQPLHVEGYALGGNLVPVTCFGRSTNLHKVWDVDLLDLNLNVNHGGSLDNYISSLITRIATDDFSIPVSQWFTCDSSRSRLGFSCPLTWARESNALDCSTVFTYQAGTDICSTGTYAANAAPVIDLQIARAGYRLANWLNTLLDPPQSGRPSLRIAAETMQKVMHA